jgi:hypothetical protein
MDTTSGEVQTPNHRRAHNPMLRDVSWQKMLRIVSWIDVTELTL